MGDAHGLGIGMEARREDSDLLQQDEGKQTGVPLMPFPEPHLLQWKRSCFSCPLLYNKQQQTQWCKITIIV